MLVIFMLILKRVDATRYTSYHFFEMIYFSHFKIYYVHFFLNYDYLKYF